MSQEQKRAETYRRIQSRFESESLKATQAYRARKKEEAKQWAIRKAKQAGKSRNAGGKY